MATDPNSLADQLQAAAFALGHTLTEDVRIDPERITKRLLAAVAGMRQAIAEVASAAEDAELFVPASHLLTAAKRQDEVGVALLAALDALKGHPAG